MRLPAPTDIVMRVDAVTICGTDLHILKGDVPEVRDPGVGDGLPGSRSRAVIDEGFHRRRCLPGSLAAQLEAATSASTGGSLHHLIATSRRSRAGAASARRRRISKSPQAGLLIVGSRRLHGLSALGSVSERLAHVAPCSVLIVRGLDSAA